MQRTLLSKEIISILTMIDTLTITLSKLNIDKNKHQKLYKLSEEIFNDIKFNQGVKRITLLRKIVEYISYSKDLIYYKEFALLTKKALKCINNTFPLTKEEEIIDIALQEYLKDSISLEEYFLWLYPKEAKTFDGKLTKEELARLMSAGFTSKQITDIENFVMSKRNYLSGFHDLVGDELIPSKQFLFNMKHIGKIFTDDPEKALGYISAKLRSKTTAPLIKALGGNFMTSKQVFENRNELMGIKNANGEIEPDKGIILPSEPVIWAPNHHFKDDALATIKAAQRPFYFMFGSIPLYFNTLDGFLTYLNGAILINRNNKKSKKDALIKAARAIDLGIDLFWSFEATHNKTANQLVLDAWNGIYRLANEKGIKVVPISHYIKDPTQSIIPHELNLIHTIVDDPIDLTKFTEKSGLNYLKDVISTWYYLMMEKYGKMTREELINAYQTRAIYYGVSKEVFDKRPLTTAEIGTLYNMDLRSTVASYDKDTETISDYHDENIILPEDVYSSIAKIENPKFVQDSIYAKELNRTRKYENYQKRF